MPNWLIVIFSGYLIGAIPFGYLVPRIIKGTDIRKEGSGNPGATNVARTMGYGYGAVVFALDFAKGFLPAYFAPSIFGATRTNEVEVLAIAGGLAAILGHMFPLFLGFRGGKGVATGAGVFAAIAPLATLVAFGAWLIAVVATKFISVGSILAAVILPVSFVLIEPAAFGTKLPVLVFCAVAGALVVFRHRSNIARLIRGQESKFGQRANREDSAVTG